MRRLTVLTTLGALLALLLPVGVAFGQQPPPGPTVRYQTKFEVPNPPAEFEVVQMVLDFAPGAWTPPHTHGGTLFTTVMEGETTVRGKSGEQKYGPGQTFVEIPGEVNEVGNSAAAMSRVLTSALLPTGAALTTIQQSGSQQPPPGATTVYQYKSEVVKPTGPFEVIHQVLDFAPGAFTPLHYHGGQDFVTVVAGEQIVRQDGAERRLKAGETWTEAIGQHTVAGNPGPENLNVVATFLLPKGAQLTTPVQGDAAAPAMLPKTGEADPRAAPAWLLLVGGSALLAAGWLARRRPRQA